VGVIFQIPQRVIFHLPLTLLHIYDISNKPVTINGAIKIDKSTATRTQYDLIICSNVLEHIPHPIDIVLDIKMSMRIDTVLYIEVPLEDIVRTNDAKTAIHQKRNIGTST
jgi:2-polyprenyl-3-methyl-5-hydroxy-6-metoxy-1,4-benzoquinol methylase